MPAPTPAIPTFSTGDILTQTSMAGITSNLTNLYNFVMGGFRTLKPVCAIRVTSTTQSIPNNTTTIITFDLADSNTDNMWVATGSDHMTVNTAGLYRLYGQVGHVAGLSEMTCAIMVNGTNFNTDCVGRVNATANVVNCGGLVPLSVGASIYLGVSQKTGAAVNLSTVNGGTRLVAEWVSP